MITRFARWSFGAGPGGNRGPDRGSAGKDRSGAADVGGTAAAGTCGSGRKKKLGRRKDESPGEYIRRLDETLKERTEECQKEKIEENQQEIHKETWEDCPQRRLAQMLDREVMTVKRLAGNFRFFGKFP